MSISRALGAEKPATKRPRSYMEGPRSGKTNCKKSKKTIWKDASRSCIPQEGGGRARARARARAPLFPVPSARAGFFLYTYLSTSTYLSLYNIYIYIHIKLSLSLSLFEQVKLLERA